MVVREVTPKEWAAISHVRGYCHDGAICPICVATKEGEKVGYNKAIKMVAEGVSS